MHINVVTWNLLHPDWALPDRYRNCPRKALAWEHRKPLVEQELNKLDADFICVQECPHEDYPEVKGYQVELALNKSRRKSIAKGKRPLLCAIYYRAPWLLTARKAASRSLSVSFVHPQGGTLSLRCVHLPVEAKEQEAHLKDLTEDVVCGDLNNFPDTEPVALVHAAGYSKWAKQPRSTYYRSDVIDYIFCRDESQWRLAPRLIWGTPARMPSIVWPSDHTWLKQTFALHSPASN
jgi:mRNA deadenylase 3'-5' endonuclease subunit Ccr4